jgi:signal transduction histidine kinase
LGCLGVLIAVAVAAGTLGEWLPTGIDPRLSPAASGRPLIVGHPTVLGAQCAAVLLFAAAAVGFGRRAARTGDELTAWLAAGATLAAFARVNYFLFPSLYSEWVYTGDVLRLAFYLTILVGAAREIRDYWGSVTAAAVLEERRRIARELHDGLAQELAFIVTESGRLSERKNGEVARIAAAAERALGESRRAIAALTRPLNEPLAALLSQVAGEVAERCGLALEFDLDQRVDVPPAAREALLRIVREAVTNACRHGRASVVRIELSNDHGVRLRVVDNGSGFDPARVGVSGAGFGLTSMRQRGEALGGSVRIESRPGKGAAVEVRMP